MNTNLITDFGFRPLNDFFWDETYANKHRYLMRTDIRELEGNYVLDIELPGFEKKDIKLSLEDGYLTVSAERRGNEKKENRGTILTERFYGTVSRSYYVGDIDEEEIKAAYKDGVLTINFPKECKKALPKHSINID